MILNFNSELILGKQFMRILIFSWRGPKHPNAGGAEISTHEHAKGWVKAGHQVVLFTSYFEGGKKEEIIDGVKIIRKGFYAFGVHFQALRWYLFENKLQFDLVIDQFHGIPFFTFLYVRCKKLGFIHEVTKEVWKLNPWSKPFNMIPAILGPFFEQLIFELFYRNIPFMTVSESTKKDLIEWGIPQNQITVIHNGLSVTKLTSNTKKETKRTLIFLGTLSKDKGIEQALKAFSLIEKYEKQWQFWVVGKADSRYLKKLKVQSKHLGINQKVKFWGFVSDRKKFELLSKAHIAINPSIREGWGLVVIEAASMGIPTAAFDVPGIRDSIIPAKTGIICSENTIDDLARSILEIVNNVKKYKQMSKNAIIWSKEFSWSKSIKKSLYLIETLN